MGRKNYRQVLDCASPLALSITLSHCQRRQRAGAVQDAAATNRDGLDSRFASSRWRQCFLAILAAFVVAASAGFAQTNSPSLPPPPPVAKPPVDFFRELLALSPSQRDNALKDRPPENKGSILAKVREYESLNPDERELRLRATELRWHLATLMPLSPTNRAAQLNAISEPMRNLIEGRLSTWDKLSPDGKEAVLKAESSLQRAVQVLLRRLTLPSTNAPKPTPEQNQKFEEALKLIRRLPADQQKLITQLDHYFELKPEEKTKVLGALSETERKEMEKSLEKFARLPKEQQKRCVNTVTKLASLPAGEQRQFLQNAERWQAMSAAERQAWRDLVHEIPGILPSPTSLPPPPPNPPGLPVPVVSTNKRASNQL